MKKVAILTLGLIGVAVVGVGLLWWLGRDASVLDSELDAGFVRLAQTDQDGDGLADWEEELWQTNPQNPDSDGDGTSDGAEVSAGRDPRLAGPDDQLTNPDRRLQALVRNAVKTQGRPLASAAGTSDLPTTNFRSEDLTLASAETAATLAAYAEGLNGIIAAYAANHQGNPAAAAVRFLDQNDPAAAAELQLAAAQHLALLRNLLALPVPASAATLHLALVNQLAEAAEDAYFLAQLESEPVLALESARTYTAKYWAFLYQLTEVKKYFTSRQIDFSFAYPALADLPQ